jgi:hypothetical protein
MMLIATGKVHLESEWTANLLVVCARSTARNKARRIHRERTRRGGSLCCREGANLGISVDVSIGAC